MVTKLKQIKWEKKRRETVFMKIVMKVVIQ